MIYTVESENNEQMGFRWIPERNELQMKRSRGPNTSEQTRDLLSDAQHHPWTWCYLPNRERS